MSNRVVGFTQGAFDMFHIGHLNLLRKAKEKCDYLIVGVNTDELIKAYKKRIAVVPFEERIKIVEAIRYTDKVIPTSTLKKEEFWKMEHFEKLFIGDDWKGSLRWKETEKTMEKFGVEVVYLPYTNGTTSTLLREKLIEL